MKNWISIVLFLPLFVLSQEKNNVSVESSVFNIQTGLLGFWVNNELKLSNFSAIRTELGISPLVFGQNNTGWQPIIRIEPRAYYNFDKRLEKGKIIDKNSGSFLGLAINYRPNAKLFSKDKSVTESFSIIPKWGIRRVNNNFNYELGAGLGYAKDISDKENSAEIDLHVRIGYTF